MHAGGTIEEGLFFATLEGRGHRLALPFSRLASRVFAAAPRRFGTGGKRRKRGRRYLQYAERRLAAYSTTLRPGWDGVFLAEVIDNGP
ncbi:hypothetical protein [Paenibacillus glycanilyticus]|uniref:hypothetical protein n=1 Tax=Paenibacillus glycanilyticus TaxID=126569 RepID=UPI0037C6616E